MDRREGLPGVKIVSRSTTFGNGLRGVGVLSLSVEAGVVGQAATSRDSEEISVD